MSTLACQCFTSVYVEFSQTSSSSLLTPRASYKSHLSTLILDNAASTLSVNVDKSIFVFYELVEFTLS